MPLTLADGFFTALARANADAFVKFGDEYFATVFEYSSEHFG